MHEQIHALLAYLHTERKLSPSTVGAYRNDLLQFAEFLRSRPGFDDDAGLIAASIDRERIVRYLFYLRDRGYSSASMARKTAALRALFRYLRRIGDIKTDPTVSLGLPDATMALSRTARDTDLLALFAYCENRQTPEGMRDHAMLRLLRATGMRVGEFVGLDVSDVDFSSRRVRVIGRGHRARTLPLDAATLASVELYLQQARPLLTRYVVHQTALVVNRRGQRLTRYGFWSIMKSLARDAGLPSTLTPTTLRLSFASHQLGEGLGLEELRRLLGHASITTTQVYTRLAARQPSTRAVRPVA